MATSIGAARAALYTLLTTAAADSGNGLYNVQISFGPPDQYEENEVVAILGIREPTELSRVLGPQTVRREEYAIELAVKCYKPDGTAQDVDTRTVAMYEAVRAIIKANLKISDTVAWALPTGVESDGPVRPAKEDGSAGYQPGWVMRLDMRIQCTARA